MDLSSYIAEAKEYIDLKTLKGETLMEELINSVLRLKQEQDSWSDEVRTRIHQNAEKWASDKVHDEDIKKFRLELAQTIRHLLMLSEKYKAEVGHVMWNDIEARRIQNTPSGKEEFKNIVVKKMADKLWYQKTSWNSDSFNYPYTLEYEFMFLGTLEPKVAADYLKYIKDKTIVPEPLDSSHIEKLLEEFADWSQYSIGESWANSLRESLAQ